MSILSDFEASLDKRTILFDLSLVANGQEILLFGESSSEEVGKEFCTYLEEKLFPVKIFDCVVYLPEDDFVFISEGLVNLFDSSTASAPESVVTQLLYGSPARKLKEENSRYLIQGPDGYLGWVEGSQVSPFSEAAREEWKQGKSYLVASAKAFLVDLPTKREVLEIYHGSEIRSLQNKEGYHLVISGEQRELWVHSSSLEEKKEPGDFSREELVSLARFYEGCPYLWAGTSFQGLDCSGYIQRVLDYNGIYYPRDANQQYLMGQVIDLKDGKKGDLVFFSTYRTGASHVGFYLGEGRFIHAGSKGGHVKINSLLAADALYDDYYAQRFLGLHRLNLNYKRLAPWFESFF